MGQCGPGASCSGVAGLSCGRRRAGVAPGGGQEQTQHACVCIRVVASCAHPEQLPLPLGHTQSKCHMFRGSPAGRRATHAPLGIAAAPWKCPYAILTYSRSIRTPIAPTRGVDLFSINPVDLAPAMFRRRAGGPAGGPFDAGMPATSLPLAAGAAASAAPAPAAEPPPPPPGGGDLQTAVAAAVAAARQQPGGRLRSGAGGLPAADAPGAAGISGPPRAGQLTPLAPQPRTRMRIGGGLQQQQQQQQQPQGSSAFGIDGSVPHTFSSVFTNPLSSAAQHQRAGQGDSRQQAALDRQQSDPDASGPAASPLQPQPLHEQGGGLSQLAPPDCAAAPPRAMAGKAEPMSLEVHAEAALDPGGTDQEELLPGAALGDGLERLAAQQQYVYDQDTGQLVRVGEGADGGSRLARHYLEDWNTGDFYPLSDGRTGCLAWLRRKPRAAPPAWAAAPPGAPSLLRGLADFTRGAGGLLSGVGLFAQGLGGGLALLALFMGYLEYATGGLGAFLAYHSAHAQLVNRAFFSLISLSLVAATSRLAFDRLGQFRPEELRLRLADRAVLALYAAAYAANLAATPLDDALTYEARRDPGYWASDLPQAFVRKVGLWQALNLVRLLACGAAWALACYRSNPLVMEAVFEARAAERLQQLQRHQEGGGGGGGGSGGSGGAAAAPVGALSELQLGGRRASAFGDVGIGGEPPACGRLSRPGA